MQHSCSNEKDGVGEVMMLVAIVLLVPLSSVAEKSRNIRSRRKNIEWGTENLLESLSVL